MVWNYVAAGAALWVGKTLLDSWTTPEHEKLVKKTYNKLDYAASGEHSIYVDHISPNGSDGQPDVYDGRRPDIVLKDFQNSNLIVEIETADTLNKEAREQLEAFSLSGYKRVLVVPDDALPEARRFATDVDGKVYVKPPEGVPSLL